MLRKGLDKGVDMFYTGTMIINRRKLKIQRRHALQRIFKVSFALIASTLFFIAFAKFEAWFNSDYYTARCAGYGYQADCKTPLNYGK